MRITDEEAAFAHTMGVSRGDMNIASDLVDRAVEAGLEAMTRVGKLHHNQDMQASILGAAAIAISAGAGASIRANGDLKEMILVRLLVGDLTGAVSVSRSRESTGGGQS